MLARPIPADLLIKAAFDSGRKNGRFFGTEMNGTLNPGLTVPKMLDYRNSPIYLEILKKHDLQMAERRRAHDKYLKSVDDWLELSRKIQINDLKAKKWSNREINCFLIASWEQSQRSSKLKTRGAMADIAEGDVVPSYAEDMQNFREDLHSRTIHKMFRFPPTKSKGIQYRRVGDERSG